MNLVKDVVPFNVIQDMCVDSFGEFATEMLDNDFKQYIEENGHNIYHDSGDIDVEYLSDVFIDFMLADVEDESLELEDAALAFASVED